MHGGDEDGRGWTQGDGAPGPSRCERPDEYLSWDGVHLTQHPCELSGCSIAEASLILLLLCTWINFLLLRSISSCFLADVHPDAHRSISSLLPCCCSSSHMRRTRLEEININLNEARGNWLGFR